MEQYLQTIDFQFFVSIILVSIIIVFILSYSLKYVQKYNSSLDPSKIEFKKKVSSFRNIAIVVPKEGTVDELAAAVGLKGILENFGLNVKLYSINEISSEDAKAFKNIFDINLNVVGEDKRDLSDNDVAVVVGGGGKTPSFGMRPPVIALIRHRPSPNEEIVSITEPEYGSTSTIVAELAKEYNSSLDKHEITALLYGIRSGTHNFRKATGEIDYKMAGELHSGANLSRIENLRAPSMSGETFDVVGNAINNRFRYSSLVISNIDSVPSISALEEASDTMLRLEGASTTVSFGVYNDTIVAACRSEDIRVSALNLLQEAFEQGSIGGTTESATARVPLGLFSDVALENKKEFNRIITETIQNSVLEAYESL